MTEAPDGNEHHEDALANVDAATLRLIHDELNIRRASLTTRWNSADTKSALLVTAASVLTGLQLRDAANGLTKAAAVVALLGALVGIAGLWPRRAPEMDAGQIRDKLLGEAPTAAELRLVDTKIDVHEKDEAMLGGRAKRLRVGFALVGLSVLLASVAVMFK